MWSVCMLSCFSHVRLCVTLWTIASQAPLSTEFSRQEYWSELPCPPPGDLSHLGIKPASLMSPALADGCFTTSAIWKAHQPPWCPHAWIQPVLLAKGKKRETEFSGQPCCCEFSVKSPRG